VRLVLFSDTHGQHEKLSLPDGDVLVFAGDMCRTEAHCVPEARAFLAWLADQPHAYKICIAGNHDWPFEFSYQPVRIPSSITYLKDSGADVAGLRFWGSPIQPAFCDWAFNRERGEEIAKHWKLIPDDTDVLITHGPPWGILDRTQEGFPTGCEALADELRRIKPKLHVFGHIHEGYGQEQNNGTLYVNASVLDRRYRLVNAPVVVDL
jgi:Icc-related predicted phosphoesterase